jgi:hypothetical protein
MKGEDMKLALALGVGLALAWVLGAILIGVSPSHWGIGIAMSVIIGMAVGATISVGMKHFRAR